MCFMNSQKKLNINKKGFSLIELLVAVAIFAIITPVLVEGFIYASKLNYRSRLQQRVDSAANSVYEGISSVKYEDLEHYLSEENGWTDVFKDGDGNYTASRVHQLQEGDTLDDCKITVAITKYSESYVVPNLNLIGVNSDYLTLVDEINESDGVVAERIEQYIKTNEGIKTKIKEDIKSKSNGKITSIDQIKSSDIIVECGKINTDIISKQTNIILDLEEYNYNEGIYKFVVDYNTQYRYPAAIANPDLDSSTLKIPYSYSQNHGGKWISLKEEVDIGTFTFPASSGEIFVYTDKNEAQNMFIYYNPLSRMDWVDIKSNDIGMKHNVFFVEQNTLGVDTLCIGDTAEETNNNFNFTDANKSDDGRSPTELQQGNTIVSIYSNNKNISKNGIPDSIYESSEKQENLYRVQVNVTYDSSIFAEVSGEFKAGGGTVGNYGK